MRSNGRIVASKVAGFPGATISATTASERSIVVSAIDAMDSVVTVVWSNIGRAG